MTAVDERVTVRPLRVLVTGSRDWPRPTFVWAQITAYAQEQSLDGVRHAPCVVVHGACRTGADQAAAVYARAVSWLTEEPHPADWARYGPRAGPIRNEEIVAAGADVCLAFLGYCTARRCQGVPRHYSHGASHALGLARDADIECRWFDVDGRAG